MKISRASSKVLLATCFWVSQLFTPALGLTAHGEGFLCPAARRRVYSLQGSLKVN
jgi:hypothetical protein